MLHCHFWWSGWSRITYNPLLFSQAKNLPQSTVHLDCKRNHSYNAQSVPFAWWFTFIFTCTCRVYYDTYMCVYAYCVHQDMPFLGLPLMIRVKRKTLTHFKLSVQVNFFHRYRSPLLFSYPWNSGGAAEGQTWSTKIAVTACMYICGVTLGIHEDGRLCT